MDHTTNTPYTLGELKDLVMVVTVWSITMDWHSQHTIMTMIIGPMLWIALTVLSSMEDGDGMTLDMLVH